MGRAMKRDRRRGWLRSASLAALLAAGGCGLTAPEAALPWVAVQGALAPAPPGEPVRRVLLLPFVTADAPPGHGALLQAAFAQSLRAVCGFEVVAPDDAELPRTTRDELSRGRVRSSESLIRLHREWGCDAILSGRVAFSRAHGEPAAGLELALVDARDGRLLWTARDVVDARTPPTRASLLRFRADEAASSDASSAPDDAAQVPAECFARFVALSFVRTLYPPRGREFPDAASAAAR